MPEVADGCCVLVLLLVLLSCLSIGRGGAGGKVEVLFTQFPLGRLHMW